MSLTKEALAARLALPQFPKSSKYDPEWIVEHSGGPHVLWLAEALSQVMDLKAGMRILDMGCGRAISSIFLAKEFGVQVWATDLWVFATDNWDRILDAGVEDSVFPIHAEAHTLPFADGFFDAAFSIDAYHYFGTDDLYIDRYSRLVKPGGQIGIVVPGLTQEFEAVPDELAPYWVWDYCSFHSPDWWRHHWEKSGKVGVELADLVSEGAAAWLRWAEACEAYKDADPGDETAMVRTDGGRWLGFPRLVARMTLHQ